MTINISDKSPKTFIVLGAHQGGTSIVSKALNSVGIDMGVDDYQVYENTKFVKLNTEILHKADGSWNNPPDPNNIEKIIKSNPNLIKNAIKDKNMWGFKDPRSALTIQYMLPYLKDDVYLVCVFRKVNKVSDSLVRSGKSDSYNAPFLTREYYKRILDAIKCFLEN